MKIATFNGTPFVIDMIQNGQVEMDIGENLDWIAYGMLDAQMRRLCGLAEVNDPKIPLLIFDKDNAASAGTPPEASKGYGDAYVAGLQDPVEACSRTSRAAAGGGPLGRCRSPSCASRTSPSISAAPGRSTTSGSRSAAAKCTACSARTARANRR